MLPGAHVVVFSAPTEVDDRKSVDSSKHMRANGDNASELSAVAHPILSATHVRIVKLQRLRTTIYNSRKIGQNEAGTQNLGAEPPQKFSSEPLQR